MEAVLACAVFTILIPAVTALAWSLTSLRISAMNMLDGAGDINALINYGVENSFASTTALQAHEYSQSTCTLGATSSDEVGVVVPANPVSLLGPPPFYSLGFDLGTGNIATGIVVKNDVIYETANSANQSLPDFYIISKNKVDRPTLISSLNTGPGLASLVVAGPYAYVANLSTVSQLQIIDIHDRINPVVVGTLKLNPPNASSTLPKARSIAYDNGLVYLGTEKWDGKEFNIIDVHDPVHPQLIGGYEIGSVVNDIKIRGAYAYVASAGTLQISAISLANLSAPLRVSAYSPLGNATDEGKIIGYYGDTFYLCRAGGGFGIPRLLELFAYNTPPSGNINLNAPFASVVTNGGIYSILARPGYIILANGNTSGALSWMSNNLSSIFFTYSNTWKPISLACDHTNLYILSATQTGFTELFFNQQI